LYKYFFWAKRKASLGGFGVLFFKYISSQFEELIYSKKKRNFIDFLECVPENGYLCLSFFHPYSTAVTQQFGT
jgi:hypothetical protein